MYWKNDVKFTSPLSSICQTALAEAPNPYCVLDIYILQLVFFSLGVMKTHLFLWLATLLLASSVEGNWQEWWTYDGISGPGYWGVINPAWTLCTRGRHQSPINIDPGQLVRDLSLDEAPPFTVDKRPISGSLYNTGQALVFRVDSERAAHLPVNITGGPLAYR